MDWLVGELPLHPLLVHLTVVAVPVAALALLLSTLWPAARRRLGLATPILALLALVCVPVTVWAGEWLAERVGRTPLVDRHEGFGQLMLPWAIAMFVVAAAVWAWHRFGAELYPKARTAVALLLGAAAIVSAVGAMVLIVLIGESGAAAVWTGNFTPDL
jgi:hypothetical protein